MIKKVPSIKSIAKEFEKQKIKEEKFACKEFKDYIIFGEKVKVVK